MFCPECRDEYEPGVVECAECKVPLVEMLPPEPEMVYEDYTTIFSSGSPAVIAVAKSILDASGIKYVVKGEGLQDLFALGSFGTGFNPVIGSSEILVGLEDEKDARKLLGDLEES